MDHSFELDATLAGARLTSVAVVGDITETAAVLAAAAAGDRHRHRASPLRLWPLAQLRLGAAPPTQKQLQAAGLQEGELSQRMLQNGDPSRTQ